MIQVLLRIFDDHAEVDLLQSNPGGAVGGSGATVPPSALDPGDGEPDGTPGPAALTGGYPPGPAQPANQPDDVPVLAGEVIDRTDVAFADWLAAALRRDGMTMEAASRRLGVSVKTVSRWVGGATEPRLRDLSRIRDVFGDLPFP